MFNTTINYKNNELDFFTHNPKKDRVVSFEIANNKTWEPYLTNIWTNHISPGDIVIDIGANIGWYSKMALLTGAEVYAFEPDERSFSILKKNCPEANLYNVCVGDNQQEVMFNPNGKNFGDSRASLNAGGIKVNQVTLDEIMFDKVQKIKAIKIDVQGWEPYVINGGWKTFSNLLPGTMVLLEFSPYMITNNNFNITSLNRFFSLFSKSYAFTNINPSKIITIDEMIKWGIEVVSDETKFADTVNIV